MTNIFQQSISSIIALLSLVTAIGVLLHDTGIDKAVSSAYKVQTSDLSPDMAKIRSGSNLHPHAEHLTVKKDGHNHEMTPKRRISKKIASQAEARRSYGCGFHSDGLCLPLAGEWI